MVGRNTADTSGTTSDIGNTATEITVVITPKILAVALPQLSPAQGQVYLQ
jgi:hypothetical protein